MYFLSGQDRLFAEEKCLLTVNFRADGASKFAIDNKWAMFPSAALGWRVSEEAFLKSVKTVSNLKLRASWEKRAARRCAVSVVRFACNQYQCLCVGNSRGDRCTGRPRSQSDLKWETTAQTNLGIDLGVLDETGLTDRRLLRQRDQRPAVCQEPAVVHRLRHADRQYRQHAQQGTGTDAQYAEFYSTVSMVDRLQYLF